jgi:hypothetical protein
MEETNLHAIDTHIQTDRPNTHKQITYSQKDSITYRHPNACMEKVREQTYKHTNTQKKLQRDKTA